MKANGLKDPYSLIDFYENQIKNILNLNKENYDELKNLLNKFVPNDTLKIQKNTLTHLKNLNLNLMKQIEKLKDELSDIKKVERINFVYKNLLENFAEKVENNKKYLNLK